MKCILLPALVLLAGCAAPPPASPEARLGVAAGASVPAWATVLAGPLPATARAMLDLDALQQTRNPLGDALAARLRLAAAEELRCEPVALAARLDLLTPGSPAPAPTPHEQLAVAFARQATRAAHQVEDGAFAELLAAFGAERTVAIVHTVAYANFLCRIVHGLGVTGSMAIDALPDAAIPPPPAPMRTSPTSSAPAATLAPLAWSAGDWSALQAEQQRQQQRTPRVPLPAIERRADLSQRERDSTQRVVWSHLAYGHQPELARAWFRCLYTFHGEARLDEVFTNSLFWVVTRTKDCFY
jgi:hypothetical protein